MAGSSKQKPFSSETDLVKELTNLFTKNELTELELETETISIRLAKTAEQVHQIAPAAPVAMAPAPAAAAPAPAPAAAPAAEASVQAELADAIKSPMVGTVYLAPEPNAALFVKKGDKVSKGQTLCIIEAMKVMNPIASPQDGTVTEILVENAQPVEFDQPLFIVS